MVLAGPIVRRIEPQLASVWVALSGPANVKLQLFAERVAAASTLPLFEGDSVPAIRAGARLYFAVATVEFKDGDAGLLPGQTYSYNLTFDGAQDLQSLGLLEDRVEKEENGVLTAKGHAALGYSPGILPSFVLPPTELADLCLIHGSCRRPHVNTPDAMVWIDDFIESAIAGSRRRPHQLFLTGDQIYADDVAAPLLHMIGKRCAEGMVGVENMEASWPFPGARHSVDLLNFPVRLRKNFTISDSQFTSEDGQNHLLSFAEFCLMYLFVWSNEIWPETLPKLADMLEFPTDPPSIWRLHTGFGDPTGEGVKEEFDDTKKLNVLDEDSLEKLRDNLCKKMGEGYQAQKKVMRTFRIGLPKVRRALANVATYMIFDDHEITDDWNLNPAWVERVNTSPSGGAIVRNGMLAYALCQGWGNDPKQFDEVMTADGWKPTRQKELLEKIEELFPVNGGEMNTAVAAEAEKLLGLAGGTPPEVVTWNYTVPGQQHKVVCLDVRTRRGRTTGTWAPENLTEEALNDQLPAKADSAGPEVLVVVSSLTVLGPPVIDALLGPVLYKTFDFVSYVGHKNRRQLPGLNPDAIESWPNHEEAFERLLERLSTYPRVVLLSGDVHFATSMAMTYFRGGVPSTQIAQFTSSAMKNLFNADIRKAAQYFSFMQRVIAAKTDVERVIWDQTSPTPVNIPSGGEVAPRFLERLKAAPVRLPTRGWPDGTEQNPNRQPDRAWRVKIPKDHRLDAQRPAAVQPGEPLVPDINFDRAGYRRAAVRHAAELPNINYDRQIVFASNLGVVTFKRTGDVLEAVHELFAVHPLNEKPAAYTQHRVLLSTDPALPLETEPKVRGG
jgi:hypothetical protein